jgi:hypothetical protein
MREYAVRMHNLSFQPRCQEIAATNNPLPACQRPDASNETLARGGRTANQEDRIIPRQRPENVGPGLGVDRASNGLCAARDGTDDDHLAHAVDVAEERWEHRLEDRIAVPARRPGCGKSVLGALGSGYTRDAELSQVARQRRLRHVPATLTEELPELLLTADVARLDELADGRLAYALVCHRR